MPLLSSMKKCSAQFCVSAAYWAKYWTSQGTRKKMRLLMVGIYVYMYIYPFIPCNYMFKSRGWERPRGFNSCAVEMCECVVESAIFTLKFENSEISRWKNSSVISAWKVREKPMLSPWKCVNNLWFPSYQKKSSIVNLFSSQYVHSQHYYWSGGPWTCKSLSGKREKGHSGPKLKSMVLRSQGPRSLMNHILFLSF